MNIEDVRRGDYVRLRIGTNPHLVGRSFWGQLVQVLYFSTEDDTITFRDADTGAPLWWPVKDCDLAQPNPNTPPSNARVADQPNATQLLQRLHEREVASLRQDIAAAQRAVEAATRLVQNRDREEQALRSQIAALEKQVADLKAERDRVGKTSQDGTRFAQLEID